MRSAFQESPARCGAFCLTSPPEHARLRPMPFLSVTEAKDLAQKAHGERRDRLGYQEFDHIERVAEQVSGQSRAVAYLHDAVEDELVSFRTAWRVLSPTQFEALLLVTREPANGTYMDYIRAIRDAEGLAGDIAREIKRADLHDNMTRPCPEGMTGMREPGGRYDRALKLLDSAPANRVGFVPC